MMSRATLQIFVHAICCAKVKSKSDVDPIEQLDKHEVPPPPPPSETESVSER